LGSEFADDEDFEEFGDVVTVLLKFGILEGGEDVRRGLLFEVGLEGCLC